MKLIVCAMIEEAQDIIASFDFKKQDHRFLNFYKTQDCYLLISGIGLVNASLTLSSFLTEFKDIKKIINIGSAGSSSKNLEVLDLVVIEKVYYSTVDLTGFGYQYGQIPKEPAFYQNQKMTTAVQKQLQDLPWKSSSLASCDMFINSQEKFNNFVSKTSAEVEVFDMEAAGLCHVALRFGVDILVIKLISDNLIQKNNELQFDQFLEKVAIKMTKIMKLVLQ